MEGDCWKCRGTLKLRYFYPRPPGGGRLKPASHLLKIALFLSTPSGWRATRPAVPSRRRLAAYFYPRPPGGGRREPVFIPTANVVNFYPRPPGGGRHTYSTLIFRSSIFLSTPSGWRATSSTSVAPSPSKFLSTPSGWRATPDTNCKRFEYWISIHALRVEGDFQSEQNHYCDKISIHALRVEGDSDFAAVAVVLHRVFLSTPSEWRATSHFSSNARSSYSDFYPRPPGGGRPLASALAAAGIKISIHAPRVEGDTRISCVVTVSF